MFYSTITYCDIKCPGKALSWRQNQDFSPTKHFWVFVKSVNALSLLKTKQKKRIKKTKKNRCMYIRVHVFCHIYKCPLKCWAPPLVPNLNTKGQDGREPKLITKHPPPQKKPTTVQSPLGWVDSTRERRKRDNKHYFFPLHVGSWHHETKDVFTKLMNEGGKKKGKKA